MVGTAPEGKGGVASVVSVLAREGFLRRESIRYVSSHSAGGVVAKIAAAISSLLVVFWYCLVSGPRIVHVHSASRASFVRKSLILGLARLRGCKTIFHLHGAEFRQFSTVEAGPLMRRWIRRTLESSSAVVALSDSWSAFLHDYAPAANVLVVPNSVAVGPAAVRSKEEAGRLLFLGRAETRKGIFQLLEAVSLLKESHSKIRLAIGGDGDLDAVMAAANRLGVADRVEILGWIGSEQKKDELQRASVFVLPSHDEGLPMAMLEAMAAAKAIVVTPVGGIPEAVYDGGNGLLVPPGDSNSLAAALDRLLNDQVLRQMLGDNARNTIETRFSTDVVIKKLSALYSKLGGEAGK